MTYEVDTQLSMLHDYTTCLNHATHPLSSADISIFFIENQQISLYQEIQI